MSSGLELRVGNKYRLGRKIGSGSFGDIYLGAFRETTRRNPNSSVGTARRVDAIGGRIGRRVRPAPLAIHAPSQAS